MAKEFDAPIIVALLHTLLVLIKWDAIFGNDKSTFRSLTYTMVRVYDKF